MPSAADLRAGTTPRVVIFNGMPCSGKSTLAQAVQDALDEPWLYIALDTFTPRFPLRRTQTGPEVVSRLIAGISAAVAGVAEAGNDVLLELVARKADPVNNLALGNLLEHLAGFEVVVICVRCSLETAIDRESSRPPEMRGLAQRNYGNIDEESCDAIIDTDALSIAEGITVVRQALAVGPKGGAERLRARIAKELEAVDRSTIVIGRDEDFLPQPSA
ncbi:phosphotransferase-like protein [Actinopolymorpha pittospori]